MRALGVVLIKELVDNARDRRSLLVALIYPLMGPLLLGLIVSVVTGVMEVGSRPVVNLAVAGAQHAPAFVRFLEARGITVIEAPADAEKAVGKGRLGSAVVIPPDFAKDFEAGRTASITVVVNSARLPGLVALNRTAGLIGDFNREVWRQRIAARGVDIQILRPLAIRTVNVAATDNIAEVLLLMVPPLFIFNIFMGGVYIAIDTTSGERERGSLEPLLINPVERWVLMLGKFAAALLFTAAAVAVQLLAFKLAFIWTGGTASAFSQALSPAVMAGIFALALPLMMVAVGVQFIIATLTRSFKEAQTYLGLLPLIPAMPGMLLVVAPVQVHDWMMTVPTFGQTILFGQMIRGEAVSLTDIAVSTSATVVVAVLLIAAAARLYEREKLIFGG
jgi:sodium transport system permease protein